MKRELAFALGAQSLILESDRKTRSKRAPNDCNGVSGTRSRKRVKSSAGEEEGAFNSSSAEIENLGSGNSVRDEITKDLADNGINSPIAASDDLVSHSSIDMESKQVESTMLAEPIELDSSVAPIEEPQSQYNGDNGVEGKHSEKISAEVDIEGKQVESMMLAEPIELDSSVTPIEEPQIRLYGDIGVEGKHSEKISAEVDIESKQVESTVLAEPIELDSSVTPLEEPQSQINGDIGVEGKHSEKMSAEVEVREVMPGITKSKCEVEVETAVACTPVSMDCSVAHVETSWSSSNGITGVKEHLSAWHSNEVGDSPAELKSGVFVSGTGSGVVEMLDVTETKTWEAIDQSSAKKEVILVNGNLKTLAEKPQRRFTRSALKVNEKDPRDLSDTGTNMTATGKVENLVIVDRDHRSEVVDVSKKDFNEVESPKRYEVDDLEQNSLDKVPRTVRELFETGILEGSKVYYNGGKQGPGIRGIVRGVGISCSCDMCHGSKVLLPAQFEIHACKSYRRAAQYICLENGRSLIDILQLCRGTELKKLKTKIRKAIGPFSMKETVCRDCKESFSMDDTSDRDPICNSCTKKFSPSVIPPITAGKKRGSAKLASTLKPAVATSILGSLQDSNLQTDRSPQKGLSRSPISTQMAKRSVGKARPSLKIKQSTIKVSTPKTSLKSGKKRGRRPKNPIQTQVSCQGPSLEGSSQRKAGKITRKDLKMHRLVFDDAGLPDGTELAYFVGGKKKLEGYKKDSGIFCRCCEEVVSASQFESHAGFATRRKPYSNIYTSNGVSLHELAVSLLKSSRRDVKESDDLCMICADGGDLLLCDGCPRAFHKECASLTHQPRGTWFCRYCESAFGRDRSVRWNVNAIAAGRVSGVDSIEQISNRSIRMVKDFQEDATSCYLCRGLDFSKSGFGPRTILICDQCEREYHVGCLKTHKMADLEDLPLGEWFCSSNCEMIRSSLQSLLNREAEQLPNNLLDVIRDKFRALNAEIPSDFDVSWRLLSGQVSSEARATTRPFLSQAISILHEGFGTIVDGVTGRDLIPSIVYGRKVRNREFRGMYCAVLLVNSQVASVAVFRLFGQELVELPLVATHGRYRGKGYFQALFGCIERLFASHGVKTIVLPAAEGAEGVWLKFGFKKMNSDQVSDYKKTYWQITEFTGVVMLEKQVSMPCD